MAVFERDEQLLREKLVQAGALTDVQLRVAEDYHRSVGGSFRDIVVRLGFVNEAEVARVLAAQDTLVVDCEHIAADLASKLPVKLMRGYCVLPVRSRQGVVLACEAELEPIVREELWDLLGTRLPLVIVNAGVIAPVIEELSRSRAVRKSSAPTAAAHAMTTPPTNAALEARQPAAAQEPPRRVVPPAIPDLSVRELTALLVAKGVIAESDVRAYAADRQARSSSSEA